MCAPFEFALVSRFGCSLVKVIHFRLWLKKSRPSLEKFPNFQVGLNLGFPCFFVGFPLKSKLGKNAKYPILICKLDFY